MAFPCIRLEELRGVNEIMTFMQHNEVYCDVMIYTSNDMPSDVKDNQNKHFNLSPIRVGTPKISAYT